MKIFAAEMPNQNELNIVNLLINEGFDATLSFLCTLFFFSVD
ncbi:MAG: hypothetical protein AAB278_08140 [Pseudomonadota bacterium]